MTDKEIIKALECCTTPHTDMGCYCCKSTNENICGKLNPTIILDLIRRQQTEINQFAEANKMVAETDKTEDEILKRLLTQRVEFIPNNKDIEDIQRDAVREFAEKLKDVFVTIDGTFECSEVEEHIDDLVNEMFPEQKGEENGHRQN